MFEVARFIVTVAVSAIDPLLLLMGCFTGYVARERSKGFAGIMMAFGVVGIFLIFGDRPNVPLLYPVAQFVAFCLWIGLAYLVTGLLKRRPK